MALLDQFGTPFPEKDLQRPAVGGPNMAGWRPAAISVPVFNLGPAALGALMVAADNGDSQAWQTLAAEIERRDAHYLGVLNTRKRTVAQVPITVLPAGEDAEQKKHAAFVEEWLRTGVLQRATYDMLDAIGKGWSVNAIEWEAKPGCYRPARFLYRPQRWFEVSYEDGDTILMRDQDEPGAPPLVANAPPQAGLAAIPPHMAVIHRHPSWSSLTLQSGLTRLAAWSVMYKTFTARDWAVFVQNYGAPVRVGKYGPSASPEDRAVLWQAVSSIAGDCAAIIPESMNIEFIETRSAGSNSDMHKLRCDWLDSQVSKAVLGQTATTDAHRGSHAAGRTHRLVQEDIERADCQLLAATLNDQVLPTMVAFTFGPQPAYPTLNIGRPDEAPNEELIQMIQFAGPQGWTVRAEDLYQRFNLTKPEPGDEVVGGKPPPPPAPIMASPGAQPDGGDAVPGDDPPSVDDPGGDQAPEVHTQIRRLLDRQPDQGARLVQLMTQHLAVRAGAGLGAMVDQVRQVIEAAPSFEAMLDGLEALKLDDRQFAEAIAEGLALSELAGQAAMIDQAAARGTGA